jgi:hypothetical protein
MLDLMDPVRAASAALREGEAGRSLAARKMDATLPAVIGAQRREVELGCRDEAPREARPCVFFRARPWGRLRREKCLGGLLAGQQRKCNILQHITNCCEAGCIPMSTKAHPTCEIVSDGLDLFVVVEGVKIARRGEPGTPQPWVSLEPGWRVLDGRMRRNRRAELLIEHHKVRVQ